MSVFSILTQKYAPTITYVSPNLMNPVPPSVNPTELLQNGGPESSRMKMYKCASKNPNARIPILIEPKPASSTITQNAKNVSNYSQINIQNISNQQAQQILFGDFFPPVVPPPQKLQVPPTRSNNEPYARQPPCVGPHRWDTS